MLDKTIKRYTNRSVSEAQRTCRSRAMQQGGPTGQTATEQDYGARCSSTSLTTGRSLCSITTLGLMLKPLTL